MTTAIAVTNGTGTQTGKLFAFDGASIVALTGLAATTNGASLAARVSSRDGKTLLAAVATATQASGAASFVFDFRTAACRGMFPSGSQTDQTVRLRVIVSATDNAVADALLTMAPGVDATTVQVPA